jgi:hypothetical protein
MSFALQMLILLMLLTSIHVHCVQHPLKLRTFCCRLPVKDLLSETDGMTWFEKLHNGHGSNVQLLFCEPYVGGSLRYCAVPRRRMQYMSSTVEIEASFPFEKLLEHARMSEYEQSFQGARGRLASSIFTTTGAAFPSVE